MMRTWLLTILVCLAVFPAAAQQECIPVHAIDQEHLAFKSGEELQLVLHYKWGAINADVGKASITIDSTSVDGVSCYHIKLSARTARFYDVFFKVREGFESWVTCDGLRPVRFKRDTQENTYRATNNYVYRWDTDEPYVEANVFTSSIGAKLLALPVNSCTFDLPALFMVARNADFSRIEKGVPYPMSFLIDDDRFNVRFTLLGDDTRTFKGIGTIPCKKFAIEVVAGELFSGKEDLYMWLSDDGNRIPVWFEAPFKIGNVSGRMERIKGTRYPLKTTE